MDKGFIFMDSWNNSIFITDATTKSIEKRSNGKCDNSFFKLENIINNSNKSLNEELENKIKTISYIIDELRNLMYEKENDFNIKYSEIYNIKLLLESEFNHIKNIYEEYKKIKDFKDRLEEENNNYDENIKKLEILVSDILKFQITEDSLKLNNHILENVRYSYRSDLREVVKVMNEFVEKVNKRFEDQGKTINLLKEENEVLKKELESVNTNISSLSKVQNKIYKKVYWFSNFIKNIFKGKENE